MVQILPAIPSFGEAMARSLGEGISSGISKERDFAHKLAFEKEKGKGESEQLSKFLTESGLKSNDSPQSGGKSKIERPKILDVPDEAIMRLGLNEKTRHQAEFLSKQKEKAEKEYNTRMASQGSFDDMVDLTQKLGYSFFENPNLSPTKGKERAQFEASKGSLIGDIKDRVNKGILSNQKFNYIKNELLPSHKDTQEVKIGKLKAVAKELNLDSSSLDEAFPDIDEFVPSGQEGKVNPKNWKNRKKGEMVKMRAPDGSEDFVPKDRVKDAMAAGAVVIR